MQLANPLVHIPLSKALTEFSLTLLIELGAEL